MVPGQESSTSVGVSAEHEAEAMHDVVDDGMVVAFALVDHGHVVLGLLFLVRTSKCERRALGRGDT